MNRYAFVGFLVVTGCCAQAQQAGDAARPNFFQAQFGPGASLKLGLGLLFSQATVAVPEWGSGRAGLVRRAEWLSAGWMARAVTEYAVGSGDADLEYRRCACKGFPRRAAHALRSGLIAYRADGREEFATARFSGLAVGSLATIPMLPDGYGLRDAARRAVVAFGVDEGFNLLREFRPEIVRTMLLRGNPAKTAR